MTIHKRPRNKLKLLELVARMNGVSTKVINFPEHFSIVDNPKETLPVFDELLESIVRRVPIYLNAKHVKIITIDTLLYLLAITNKVNILGIEHAIRGNAPSDPLANAIFTESGFYNYVESKEKHIKISKECIQICHGHNADPILPRTLCVFAMKCLMIDRLKTKGLYDMIMEIILNTIQHAYDKNPMHPRWLSYTRYDAASRSIYFSFLDMGVGIPTTVRKRHGEDLIRVISARHPEIQSIDIGLIQSALGGEFRSETELGYRGKGMPMINKYANDGYIADLTIVSGRGFVSKKHGDSALPSPFAGTLYHWKMKNEDS